MRGPSIHDVARGRWRAILLEAGVQATQLTGKHTSCPTCGGKDRFRWDNKDGSGGSYCSVCGSRSGVDLLMAVRQCDFTEARKFILAHAGQSEPEVIRPRRDNEKSLQLASKLWCEARRLDGKDPASLYLRARGLRLTEYPTLLRWHPRISYRHGDKSQTWHPVMISKYVSPDGKAYTLHYTYLDGQGSKADLPKTKLLAAGVPIPKGGAVRLAMSAETMGIAEGIETALSAAQLFRLPVWAALSSGLLSTWEPPPTVRHVIIFGDHDSNFAGAAASYALAHRLACKGYGVEVRLPSDLDADWNDELAAKMEYA